jgi:hypothetical protein
MMSRLGYRVLILFVGAALAIGVPSLLLGPYMFHHMPLEYLSARDIAGAVLFGLLGLWLVIVALFAGEAFVESTAASFWAGEAFPLVAFYLMTVGSRSIWRRWFRKGKAGAL